MRTFRFTGGKSNKWWRISQPMETQNAYWVVSVSFGRVGAGGQSHTKVLIGGPAAWAYYERKIAEKIGKGYVEQQAAKPANPILVMNAPQFIKKKACPHTTISRKGNTYKCVRCGDAVELDVKDAPAEETTPQRVRRFFDLEAR